MEPTVDAEDRSPRIRAVASFVEAFDVLPVACAFAPGRVNLIGEHVDYCEGLVAPLALRRGVAAAAGLAPAGRARIVLADLTGGATWECGLGGGVRPAHPSCVLPLAAWDALAREGLAPPGFLLAVAGDLAVGSGLSSSAATLVATLRALATVGGADLAPRRAAHLAREAETAATGVRCGAMDPLACALGRPGLVSFLDCRSLEVEQVPLAPLHADVIVVDSGERRRLAETAYNARVAACEAALAALRAASPELRALRDATPEDVERFAGAAGDEPLRRARHVVAEIERVRRFRAALAAGDAAACGELLDASHRSLCEQYEVSTPHLDRLQAWMKEAGALGARLTGAGFGGCLVGLAEGGEGEVVLARVLERARREGRDAVRGFVAFSGQRASGRGPEGPRDEPPRAEEAGR